MGLVGGVTMGRLLDGCVDAGAGEGKSDGDGGAEAGAGAGGGGVAAVLAGDVADEEEAEAGALDLGHGAAGDTVEAFEDALELIWGRGRRRCR